MSEFERRNGILLSILLGGASVTLLLAIAFPATMGPILERFTLKGVCVVLGVALGTWFVVKVLRSRKKRAASRRGAAKTSTRTGSPVRAELVPDAAGAAAIGTRKPATAPSNT